MTNALDGKTLSTASENGKRWDVFISHASEDKDKIARPLFNILTEFGVRVWLDEQEIEIGDSLSRSIDAGLSRSRYGIVILSKAFLRKDWPEYELRGLVAKELGRDKVILPIWHDITIDELIQYSPSLADKKAISSNLDDEITIATKLVEIIRPDMFKAVQRKVAFRTHAITSAIDPRKMIEGPVRHDTLPDSMIWRLRLVRAALKSASGTSTLNDWINNFRRDSHPTEEIEIWECAATVFLEVLNEVKLATRYHRVLYKLIFTWISGETLTTIEDQARNLPKVASERALDAMRSYVKIGDIWEPGLPKILPGVRVSNTLEGHDAEIFDGDEANISGRLIGLLAERDKHRI